MINQWKFGQYNSKLLFWNLRKRSFHDLYMLPRLKDTQFLLFMLLNLDSLFCTVVSTSLHHNYEFLIFHWANRDLALWCDYCIMMWISFPVPVGKHQVSVVYTAQPHACTCGYTCTIIFCQNAGIAITTTVSSSSLPILKVTILTTADILKRLSDWETDLTTVSYHRGVVQVLLVMLQEKSWLWQAYK